MARYVDADKLLESLQEELDYYPLLYTREQNEWFDKGLKRALRIVKTFPTADVVPKSEVEARGASFYFSLEEAEKRGRQLMREHDAELAREIIADMRELINGYENIDVYLDRIEKKYIGGNDNG